MRHFLSLLTFMIVSPWALSQKDYFSHPNVVHFELDFGKLEPDTGNRYFDFLEDTTTFDSDDLEGQAFQFRVLYQLNNRLAIGGSVLHFDEDITSEDNFYVDTSGAAILQRNVFETTWTGLSLVWTPFGAGETFGTRGWAPRRFVPYLSAGVGIKSWELRATGEFVDDSDPNDPIIFQDVFSDEGDVFSGRLGCGLRINVHRNIDINFAFESDYAEDDLDGSFIDFGDINLDSKSAFVGIIFRL